MLMFSYIMLLTAFIGSQWGALSAYLIMSFGLATVNYETGGFSFHWVIIMCKNIAANTIQ